MSGDTSDKVEGFAALFEQSSKSTPKQQRVAVGARIEAKIARISKDAIFVDLDAKRQAWIDPIELQGPDGAVTVQVGETLVAHVVEVDGRSGTVKLGRSLGKATDVSSLLLAREQGIAIEGKVVGVNKGGIEVEVAGIKAFCPTSQVDLRPVTDAASFIGQTLKFRVTEVREGGRSVVLSRRQALEADAREASERVLRNLAPGQTVRGPVTGIREFGAFVDLGGVEGLVPASELSHESHLRPADVVKLGDVVEVQVKDIKPTDKGQTRITLSLKALSADPWGALSTLAPVGRVLAGTVTRTTDFGAFVRIAAGVEGLLHVSELGAREKAASRFSGGEPVLVVVKSADAKARKVSLALAPEGSAVGGAVAASRVVPGAIVKAVIEKHEAFGAFAQIEGTQGRAGRGLIPIAELGLPRNADVRKLLPEGTAVTAKVLEVGEGRMRFSVRAVREDEERANYEGYQRGTAAAGKMGTLGDLFAKKLKK